MNLKINHSDLNYSQILCPDKSESESEQSNRSFDQLLG